MGGAGGGGRAVPTYKLVCNKQQSEFLTGEVEYLTIIEALDDNVYYII